MTDLERRAKLFAEAVTLERAARILGRRATAREDGEKGRMLAQAQRTAENEATQMRKEAGE